MDSAELMSSYCQGNEASFEALYKRVAPRLNGYLRRMLRNGSDAEDVLQQTFVKFHLARDSFTVGADPLPWLYVIAHRACIDELRSRSRTLVQLAAKDEQLETSADFTGKAGWTSLHDGHEQEGHEQVLAALDCLTPDQRTTFVMTALRGQSLAEAASAQGVSIGAVKQRALRARRRLQAMLKPLGA